MMDKIVEWGQVPDDGMVPVVFSAEVVLEGKDLKRKIIDLLRKGQTGLRQAISFFSNEGFASLEESKRVISEIKRDLAKGKEQKVYGAKYYYVLERFFWAYPNSVPKNDYRYAILDLVDIDNLDIKKYQKNNVLDIRKLVKENISTTQKEILKKLKPKMIAEEITTEEKDTASMDKEWQTK